MKFSSATTALLVTSAAFIGNVVADEIEDALGGDAAESSTASTAPSASQVEIVKPDFTVRILPSCFLTSSLPKQITR